MPLDEIDVERLNARLGDGVGTQRPLYLICASGRRAKQAARKLQTQGMHKTLSSFAMSFNLASDNFVPNFTIMQDGSNRYF